MRLALLAAACPCALALPWRRIACMGDSITRGDTTHTDEPEEGKLDRGNYPKTLGALLGVDVANFGASGASVSGKRGYVGTDEYEDAVGFDPDCVVVMLGINDAKLAWDEDDFVEAYADLVEATIADAPSVEAVFVAAPYLAVGTRAGKGDSMSLQRECSARARFGTSTHASRALREMIARPKISRNEWETAEI